MKKYILSILALVVLMTACKEKDNDPVINLGTAPSLTSPSAGATFTLDSAELENVLTEFEWTAADFGYQAAITYTIEVDAAGNDFAEAVPLGSTNKLKLSDVTIGKTNNILLAKGLPFGFDNELEIRVCARVSDLVDPLCSSPVAIKINPFQAAVVYPNLTVPGDYQEWNPEDETYSVYSRKSDDVYEGFIYFGIEPANYKFAMGSWDTNWGDVEPDGILDPQGIDNNIATTEGVGMYLLNCDLNNLTHSNLRTDWGVLGSATAGGTSTDEDFIWDAERNLLSITTDLSVGTIRFRANDSDDLNFGDNFSNGTLEYDGDDIQVTEAGNYTIDLILNASDYSFTITKN